jgi:uncharacterized protein (TIGR02099 family)
MKTRFKKLHKRLQPHFPRLKKFGYTCLRGALHAHRAAWYTAAVLLMLLAAVYTTARIYLPTVVERKAEIEDYLSRKSAHQVRIERLSTYWDGLSPGVRMEGVQVYAAAATRPTVRLTALQISVSPFPLLWGELRIHRLRVTEPKLTFERLLDGRFRIAGFDPLEAGSPEEGEAFVNWLFRQKRLEVADGEMQWYDYRHPNGAIHLTGVNLTLRNDGERHRLGFDADFPQELCRECSFVADITGNPFTTGEWQGEIYLRAAELDVTRLPGILRERLPPPLRGRFGLELWSEWEQARPVRMKGTVDVSGLRLPLPQLPAPLAVREAHGGIDWRARGAGWELDVERLALALTGPVWSAGDLRLALAPERQEIEVQHVNLTDLTRWFATLEPAAGGEVAALRPALAMWREFRPEGRLNDLRLRLDGAWGAAEDLSLETEVAGLTSAPRGEIPGLKGLSGQLTLERDGGEFRLDSNNLTVDLARHFRAPFTVARLAGRVNWARKGEHWLIEGERLAVEGEDGKGKGEFTLRVPHDRAQSPYLNLRVDFRDGNGAHAARYYPVHDLTPKTLKWMEYAFAGGRVESGHLVYDGNLREFPFRAGQGRFEISAQVRDAAYVYLRGWEPVRQARAEVAIRDNRVLVTGEGRIGALAADQIRVEAGFGERADGWVRVNGRVRGPVDETLRVLKAVKPRGQDTWKNYLPAGLRGGGEGTLQIAVDVATGDNKAEDRIRGRYAVSDASLTLADGALAAEALRGAVAFTEAGPSEGEVQGRLLGGDTTLAIRTPAPGELHIAARGEVRAAANERLLGKAFARQLAGAGAWHAQYETRGGAPRLEAGLALQGLKSTLPAPFNRPQGLADGSLVLRTEAAGRDTHLFAVSAPGLINGRLLFVRDATGWHFDRGRLALQDAAATLPVERGLHLHARLAALDVDEWLRLRGDAGGTAATPAWLARVSAEVRALDLLNRQFGAMSVDLVHGTQGWAGTLQGDAGAGRVVLATAPASRIELDLERLNLPPKKRARTPEDETDPRTLPQLKLRVQSMEVKGRPVGVLDFSAEPMPEGWRIARFALTREEMSFEGSGAWRMVGGQPASRAEFRLASRDAGKTLEAFGVPDQLSGGEVEIKGNLDWPGSPSAVRPGQLSGRIEVSASKGRFIQLKTGAARLFGMLDLSAIGRYLTLDFSPVFGRGFVYDRIKGTVTLERGNAYTDDFSMKGPSAHIAASGRVGLAAEDFDLAIVVDPQVSDALTLGSWYFLGPQVAAAVLAVQKIFKKQIKEGTRVIYVVKGSWQEPNITRSGGTPPPAESPPGE